MTFDKNGIRQVNSIQILQYIPGEKGTCTCSPSVAIWNYGVLYKSMISHVIFYMTVDVYTSTEHHQRKEVGIVAEGSGDDPLFHYNEDIIESQMWPGEAE